MDQQTTIGPGPEQVAAEAFQALRLPTHLTLDGLIKIVAARRRRRIEVEATNILNGTSVCGLWLVDRVAGNHPARDIRLTHTQAAVHSS